tara:strand:- start:1484 stop:1780 length:297 start_codon:yes stop_codon:yes gene_type:complete
MRDDYKYPYRVTTRTEERELNDILYGLIGLPFILPFIVVDYVVLFILKPFSLNTNWKTFFVFTVYIVLIGLLLNYLGWLTPILKFLSLVWYYFMKAFS